MKLIISLALSLALTSPAFANTTVSDAAEASLTFMKSVYATTYAPAPWKAKYDNWNIDAEFNKGMTAIRANKNNMSVKDARRILMDFIYSMRDYHVSIQFYSTEMSSLPFTVRSAEGRYFIVYVDAEKTSPSTFPFKVGDEVLEFDGRPVSEVIQELKIMELNVASTDEALAELALTNRQVSRGHIAQRGPVSLTVMPKGASKAVTRQLIWEHTPEVIKDISENITMDNVIPANTLIDAPIMQMDLETNLDNPHSLGHKKGFLPKLGTAIWESSDEDLYHAYIYQNEKNELIGVIRIPAYVVADYPKSVAAFAKTIAHMEKVTDKLVIDQLNNPGGSVFYLYALASILSPEPLKAPRHRMSVTPSRVDSCVTALKQLESIDSDQKAKEVIGENIHGYLVSLQFVHFYREYCKLYIEEWQAGKTMTRPYWIAGVDEINPYSNTYSKPILILVNELDFSGGDFFPTIMQDNDRATIMGVRTAGAGGYVLNYTYPNLLGVKAFRVTESLAYRVDQNPIENLGVTPDIMTPLTANDRQNNYMDYTTAVKNAVNDLK